MPQVAVFGDFHRTIQPLGKPTSLGDCAACRLTMATSVDGSLKLSIGLPVYNGERFLAQALDCLLAQTFRNFEIIISDNASIDRTPEICRAYAQRDCRVRYVRNRRNLGAIANFNRVFELSAAPLFKWAAPDDLYDKIYLDSCVRILDDNPDVILAPSQ